jgi:superfamily II DNA/RNA helicase
MQPDEKVIIFVRSKALADHISSELALLSFRVQNIHGQLCQSDREQVRTKEKEKVKNDINLFLTVYYRYADWQC